MDKKKFYLSKIILCMLILTQTLNVSLAFVDDNKGNTDYGVGNETAFGKDSNEWAISSQNGENYTGTKYTIVDNNGTKYELKLPAGSTVEGSDKIKGYQSSGFPNLDTNGQQFNLPSDGILELEREDWAAVARANGNESLAKEIESGAKFTGYAEQYLYVYDPRIKQNTYMTASEAKSLLDEGVLGIEGIKKAIEASYNSFTEKDKDYWLKQLIMQALGLKDDKKGWAGYEYEEEDIKPKKDPTPTPDPTPIPEPTPEVPPPSPKYTVTEGYANENTNYTAKVKIDNEKFGVYDGKPIPTNEELTLNGCTTLVGAVKNLGKNTVTFTPNTYTVYAHWSRQEQRTGTKVVDGETVTYTYTVTLSGTETATTPVISGVTEYYKIRSNTDYGSTVEVIAKNDSFGTHVFDAPKGITYNPITVNDNERIIEKTVSLGGYSYAEDARAAAARYAASANWSDFWTVKTDILNSSQGIITYNGAVSDSTCNLLQEGKKTTLEIQNKSVGTAYTSVRRT